ncbi:GLIPR1-like protein 1 [Cololabis saira]|uniref:GLIPR1-like protein 1 n=1 Tax=Cololabis saira TaxID=129043 RepID=UPI002AD2A663|nr:GLIPR1-like protein 1 [Cololabis saira]
MGSSVETSLWAWIGLHLVLCSGSLPEITDKEFINECLREHNKARSSVMPSANNMLHMTWDEGLAITARAWARRCIFDHNIYLKDARRVHPTFSSVGENIWTISSQSFTPTRAIESWVNEKNHYNYQRNTCTKVCGHYTQVVWASSYKVGCAAHLCPDGIQHFISSEGLLFVCNYATAGNMNNEKPYESPGAPCSGCEGTCVDSLCRSDERDLERSYSWAPDWDWASATSGSTYVSILVSRPVALALTFIAAYATRYFYPDVFCYE